MGRRLDAIPKIVGIITAITTLATVSSQLFAWGNTVLFVFLRNNLLAILVIALVIVTPFLSVWVFRLNRRFVFGFSDDFTGDIRANWDFVGAWRLAEKGTLLVTGVDQNGTIFDEGGITKVGALWENYTLEFRARIISQCLGVIVRAQDLNNYFMFQINIDQIKPHRRVAVPILPTVEPEQNQPPQQEPQFRPIEYKIGWARYDPSTPLQRALTDWFDAKLIVRGESVRIYIDDDLIFQRESFLKIPTGKIGFRNYGTEEALVRNVRVSLQ